MSDSSRAGTARSQLERLATLTDVVYAVALVLVVTWLPLPEESHSGGAVWIFDLWAEHSDNIIGVVIGLVFSIIYWIRSNTLLLHANACISRHHVETTLGVAYNHGKDARSVGVEDEYRFKRTFGAGAFLDTTFRGFDLEAAGLGQERKLGARETPRWVSFPKQQARSLQISRNEWACAS